MWTERRMIWGTGTRARMMTGTGTGRKRMQTQMVFFEMGKETPIQIQALRAGRRRTHARWTDDDGNGDEDGASRDGEEEADADGEGLMRDGEGDTNPNPGVEGREKEDQTDYVIAGISEYSDESGEQLWRVRWSGYLAKDDSWLGADGFGNAEEMFTAYNRRHCITVRRRKRKRGQSKDRETVQQEKPDDVLIEDSPTFTACMTLLSSSTLEQELETLKGMATISPASKIRVFNPTTLLTQIAEQNITNTWVSSYLQYDSMSNYSSIVRIRRLYESVQLAAPLRENLEQVSVLQHASQWEIGRILLMVYEWLTDTAPALVDALILAHTRGPASLNKDFPNFALLTAHVMLYVREQQQRQLAAKPKPPKKKSRKTAPAAPDAPEGTEESSSVSTSVAPVASPSSLALQWPPQTLEDVPEGLYDLREATGEKTVKMPPVKQLYSTEESIQKAARGCLLELLCRELVWIPMTDTDTSMNSGKRGRRQPTKAVKGKAGAAAAAKYKLLHARLVSRGAVLRCLVDA
ncbi:hypothetical protein C8R46DRAFT_305980 [Mycena filopes]|nr:hypothetical protein C8R46DRAFT_305980 [Mycena filopes]